MSANLGGRLTGVPENEAGMLEDSFGSQRLAAHLLEIFGGSALLLSIAKLYGLLAWIVAQRMREMGVRIALGAPRGNLLWLVMRQAGGMLLVGAAAESGLAWATARFLRGYLYGVSAHDRWTLAAAAALLCASGLLAAYIPARRAASVDPMVALRAEKRAGVLGRPFLFARFADSKCRLEAEYSGLKGWEAWRLQMRGIGGCGA